MRAYKLNGQEFLGLALDNRRRFLDP